MQIGGNICVFSPINCPLVFFRREPYNISNSNHRRARGERSIP